METKFKKDEIVLVEDGTGKFRVQKVISPLSKRIVRYFGTRSVSERTPQMYLIDVIPNNSIYEEYRIHKCPVSIKKLLRD